MDNWGATCVGNDSWTFPGKLKIATKMPFIEWHFTHDVKNKSLLLGLTTHESSPGIRSNVHLKQINYS